MRRQAGFRQTRRRRAAPARRNACRRAARGGVLRGVPPARRRTTLAAYRKMNSAAHASCRAGALPEGCRHARAGRPRSA
ncbi:hypothetical protein G6F54_014242 [Rhizopus delemar]|nr:hypothetical protein G6F54_014242 [Rhizopus delemar]